MCEEMPDAEKKLLEAIEQATQAARKVNIALTTIEGRMDQIVDRLKLTDAERKGWASALEQANGKLEDLGKAFSAIEREVNDADTSTIDEPQVP